MSQLEDADIHFLCARGYFQQLFLTTITRPARALSWCSAWDNYTRGESDSEAFHHQRAIVIVSDATWNGSLAKTMNLHSEICPRLTWVILTEEEVAEYLATGRTRCKVRRCFAGPLNSSVGLTELSYSETHEPNQSDEVTASSWFGLKGHEISVGYFLNNFSSTEASSSSRKEERIIDALGGLNVSLNVVPVPMGLVSEYLATRKIDIMAHFVGLSTTRHQRFDLAIYGHGRAAYFVQKRWKRSGEIFSGLLSWTSLLALSVLVTASLFVLLNVRHGQRPFEGISQLVLALAAAVLLIASPLRTASERSTANRTILACWLLAGFSLAAYTQSLLTATLSAGPGWEADDTIEKAARKLRDGRLLPCVEWASFFHYLITSTSEKRGDFLGAMAFAAKRWSRNTDQITGNLSVCASRATKGTHLILDFDETRCVLSSLADGLVQGKSSVSGVFYGFPIKKYHRLRRPFFSLVRRILETGWHVRDERFETLNCTAAHAVRPTQKSLIGTLITLYFSFCALTVGAFLLELLHYRLILR
ncbi:hypothetical protein HPB50_003647 [Hyalomma asiaticum]|uniref:Uncharacterized protein n=1 Tax=Hyalomma asiaticum TaxID=266040 RepID=A0ACB7SEP5_HYAAI|nr:hypothetical protein HPB50_003647 [Hyalomma asiaticum]